MCCVNGTIHIVYIYVYILQQKYEQNINKCTKKEDFANYLQLESSDGDFNG